MAKKKSKSAERKAKREEERRLKKEFEEAQAKLAERRRRILIAIPLLTAGIAAFCWFGLEDRRLVGVTALIGGLVFLMVALGAIGSSVPPRDRMRSGSIDFGTRDKK